MIHCSSARLAAAIALAAAAGCSSAPAITDRDTVLVADVVNTTGDPVFDDALKAAIVVALQQTPFLSLLPEPRVHRTLLAMQRTPDLAVTGGVANDVCERAGANAVVHTSIASSGSTLAVRMTVNRCKTGAELAAQEVKANGRDDVLKQLGDLVKNVRRRLGEPGDMLSRYQAPLPEALTSSLEALQAYGRGQRTRAVRGDEAAMPFFRQAIARDSEFALAHARLGVAASSIGGTAEAREEAGKAWELRARATEYERQQIDWNYASRVLADQKAVKDSLQRMTTTYPRDFAARNNLGVVYDENGQVGEALKQFQAASQMAPDEPGPLSNSAYALLQLGRFDEASEVVDRSLAIRPDPSLAITRWIAARVLDQPRVAEFQTVARSLARPEQMALANASLAAWFGRFRAFQKMQNDLIANARATGNADLAKVVANGRLITLAAYRQGRDLNALESAAAREKNPFLLAQQLSALAMLGRLTAVRSGLKRFGVEPASGIGPSLTVPRAYVQARDGKAAAGLAALQAMLTANPRARDLHYFMADIRRQAGDVDGAIEGYRAIVGSLTYLGPQPLIPAARLKLARLLLEKRDAAGATEQLDVLLKQWKDADAGFPALAETRILRAQIKR